MSVKHRVTWVGAWLPQRTHLLWQQGGVQIAPAHVQSHYGPERCNLQPLQTSDFTMYIRWVGFHALRRLHTLSVGAWCLCLSQNLMRLPWEKIISLVLRKCRDLKAGWDLGWSNLWVKTLDLRHLMIRKYESSCGKCELQPPTNLSEPGCDLSLVGLRAWESLKLWSAGRPQCGTM